MGPIGIPLELALIVTITGMALVAGLGMRLLQTEPQASVPTELNSCQKGQEISRLGN